LILLFCLIGAYSINNNKFDVFIMVLFGIIGYLMKKVRFEAAPMLLGLVLGIMMEDALRQSLIMSGGSFQIFLSRSISAGFLLAAFVLLAIPAVRGGKKILVAKLTENE
jgi:TctA family transporter